MDFQKCIGRQSPQLINLIKLAVGVRDLDHLAQIQQQRAVQNPPLRHRTRNMPKRAAEITAGGSIYWVINRAVLVRQLITDITKDIWDDGAPCTGMILDHVLVRVSARPMKPFQGWRYLNPADAPPDLGAPGTASGGDDLPEAMRLALSHLALL